jgi:hypothetical protein
VRPSLERHCVVARRSREIPLGEIYALHPEYR